MNRTEYWQTKDWLWHLKNETHLYVLAKSIISRSESSFTNSMRREPYAVEARSRTAVICFKMRGNGSQEKEKRTQHKNHFTHDMRFSPAKQSETVRLFTSTDVFLPNSWFVYQFERSGEPHRLSVSLSSFLFTLSRAVPLSCHRQVNHSFDHGFWERRDCKRETEKILARVQWIQLWRSVFMTLCCIWKNIKMQHFGSVERVADLCGLVSAPESRNRHTGSCATSPTTYQIETYFCTR